MGHWTPSNAGWNECLGLWINHLSRFRVQVVRFGDLIIAQNYIKYFAFEARL